MGRIDLTYCNSGKVVHPSHHVCSVCTGCTLLYKHLKCFHILHQYHRLICSTGNCKICLKSTDSWQILQFTWHRTCDLQTHFSKYPNSVDCRAVYFLLQGISPFRELVCLVAKALQQPPSANARNWEVKTFFLFFCDFDFVAKF